MLSFFMVLYIFFSKFVIFFVYGFCSMLSVILVDCVWVFIFKKICKCLWFYSVCIMSLNVEDFGFVFGVKILFRI